MVRLLVTLDITMFFIFASLWVLMLRLKAGRVNINIEIESSKLYTYMGTIFFIFVLYAYSLYARMPIMTLAMHFVGLPLIIILVCAFRCLREYMLLLKNRTKENGRVRTYKLINYNVYLIDMIVLLSIVYSVVMTFAYFTQKNYFYSYNFKYTMAIYFTHLIDIGLGLMLIKFYLRKVL